MPRPKVEYTRTVVGVNAWPHTGSVGIRFRCDRVDARGHGRRRRRLRQLATPRRSPRARPARDLRPHPTLGHCFAEVRDPIRPRIAGRTRSSSWSVRSGRRRRGRFVGTRPRACPAAAETGREEALPDPSCRQLAPDRRCAGRRATLHRRRHRRAALESAETRARPVTGREGPRNQDPLASLCRADFAATHPLKDPSSHSSASHRRAAHGRTRRVGILGKSAACDTRFAHELAAFGRASAHSPMAHGVRPPTAHWTLVLIEAMPETDEATPKGARWAPKLQMS